MEGTTNSTNNSTEVSTNIYPDLTDLYLNPRASTIYTIIFAVLVLFINFSIYGTTLFKTRKRLTNHLFLPTTFICSIYPLISLAALITILLPRSWIICNTVMHISFTIGAVVFHNLCFRYANSEVGYLKEVGEKKDMDLQTTPCCCCCSFLPKIMSTKTRLFVVKCLIWQMPFLQSSIMIILNVLYYTEQEMYDKVFIFFVPFIVTSIICGLWGLNITVKMISKLFPDHNLLKKMFSLQLILLLCKLQYVILDTQLNHIDFGGIYPITNTIFKQTIINLLILIEMTFVSLLVQHAYSKPAELE